MLRIVLTQRVLVKCDSAIEQLDREVSRRQGIAEVGLQMAWTCKILKQSASYSSEGKKKWFSVT